MMRGGTQLCVLGLLEGEPESRRWLYDRCALEVFDVVPRDCVEPLETHDFFIKRRASSRPNMAGSSSAGAAVEA